MRIGLNSHFAIEKNNRIEKIISPTEYRFFFEREDFFFVGTNNQKKILQYCVYR
jgi:hypothetical protein